MENLVLSKKAQKKALSGKKGNRETVKNVLATPYSNHFPLLKPEDAELISEALRALPKLRAAKTSVPWTEIKDVPQVDRKKTRAKYATEVLPDVDPVIRSNLIFGVNEVTKLLENKCAAAVLVADDVKPLFMVKHVIDLCVYCNTPVVVVPGLRNLMKTVVGITTLTLAVKKPVIEGNCLHTIAKCVEEISLQYSVPENHVHYKRVSDEEEEEGDLDATLKSLELDERKVGKNLYLYRNSKGNGRVFVPELSKKDLAMDVDVEGFIGFGAIDSGNKNKLPKKTLTVYKGLQVKRVRNNKDRKKKLKMKL